MIWIVLKQSARGSWFVRSMCKSWLDGWMDYCLRVFDSMSTCPVIVLLKHSLLSLILCNSGAGPEQEVTDRHRKCCWSLAVVFLGRKDEGCLLMSNWLLNLEDDLVSVLLPLSFPAHLRPCCSAGSREFQHSHGAVLPLPATWDGISKLSYFSSSPIDSESGSEEQLLTSPCSLLWFLMYHFLLLLL